MMTDGSNATYLPPPSPSREFSHTTPSAGTVDRRPQGTVAPQGGYALAGAGISPIPHQDPFSAVPLSSGLTNAHYATWSHDRAILDPISSQQMSVPHMIQGDTSYVPQMPIDFTSEWAPASWSGQPPPNPLPPLPQYSASSPLGASTNVELYTTWTTPMTHPSSSSLFGAVVPQYPSTHPSSSIYSQLDQAMVPTASLSMEQRSAAAMYVVSCMLESS
jgi:hypothetical protein